MKGGWGDFFFFKVKTHSIYDISLIGSFNKSFLDTEINSQKIHKYLLCDDPSSHVIPPLDGYKNHTNKLRRLRRLLTNTTLVTEAKPRSQFMNAKSFLLHQVPQKHPAPSISHAEYDISDRGAAEVTRYEYEFVFYCIRYLRDVLPRQ